MSHAALMRGCTVRQLTNFRGHSHHLVGELPCWMESGRRLVLVSDREGWGNLFVYDFVDASLRQLTDLRGAERPSDLVGGPGSTVIFRYGTDVYELDCDSLWLRPRSEKYLRTRGKKVSPRREAVRERVLADGRRLIYLGRALTPLVATGGSGRAPFATTAPCLSPEGRRVVFSSDAGGYAQVYSAELPCAADPGLD